MNFPDFHSKTFLRNHIEKTLDFYATNIDDPFGGFFQNFNDDGTIYDKNTRHLVSSTRFIFNYARAFLQFGRSPDLARVRSGIEFLRRNHLNFETGGYHWLLNMEQGRPEVLDGTNHCYGLAFVILAYSWAYRAGIDEAIEYLEETWQLMELYFWDEKSGLYRDEFTANFSECSAYRGQNANMHSCEAMIAAYQATQDPRYFERALLVADNIVNRQTETTNGLIWEHYHNNWQPDWDYNKKDPKNLFRPWGFQPGHQTEWAKLLLIINRYQPQRWLVAKAESLFDAALSTAWDQQNGGICYGFAPDSSICDGEKYFWVQAESLAAAALLAEETENEHYWLWYEKIWQYSWQNFVDHQYGAWFRILSQDNKKLESYKSPIGKTDYHTMGACYDVMTYCKNLKS